MYLDCKYFVLLWIPCNLENGLTDSEYDLSILAFSLKKHIFVTN